MSRRTRKIKQPPQPEQQKSSKAFFSGRNKNMLQAKKEDAFFQTKLSVNEPGDKFEKEADAVATQVTQPGKAPAVQQKKISGIQRLATSHEDEKLSTNDARMEKDKEIPEKPIQKKENGTAASASPALSARVEQSAGKGSALPSGTLAEFQSSFNTDFSGVRVHTDSEAAQMNKELHAQAFTHGRDIYFSPEKYRPETAAGRQLLAHELTHVVQQGGGDAEKIQRQPADTKYTPSDDDLNKISAVVGAEGWEGQEKDLEWVYYNLVIQHNGIAQGLRESHAYRAKSDHFKLNLYLLGDTQYAKDKPASKTAEFKDATSFEDLVSKNAYYKKEQKRLQGIKDDLDKLFKDPDPKDNPGFNSNANLEDVNRSDDWAMRLREYLFLEDAKEVDGSFVKRLGKGKTWQVVYNSQKIQQYFAQHKGKLPKQVPAYKP